VSRGFGALQRRVLDGLLTRADYDRHPLQPEYPYYQLFDESDTPLAARARWRWYTIDLLDLVDYGAPRSDRASLNRAVRGLAEAGLIELADRLPYEQPFAPNLDRHGLVVGGVDLNELNWVDHRWPNHAGRVLWFRLKPPTDPYQIPNDDQIAILDDITRFRPDAFLDFAEAIDHVGRWRTAVGRFLIWLFCGHQLEP
jgi:hypothetical protein